MNNKKECVKNTIYYLEKIVDSFEEILGYLKGGKGSRIQEMQALVFSKAKSSELATYLERILQNLVELKYLKRNSSLNFEEQPKLYGFKSLIKELNQSLNPDKQPS